MPLHHYIYDGKRKRLLALPFSLVSGTDVKLLIDNKHRRIVVDRRVEEKKIVAFSVSDQGDLVRVDYAMPTAAQALTFSGSFAFIENGAIAPYGSDGITWLGLGSASETVMRDAYKKPLKAVVKDGATYTFVAMVFSGHAHHLLSRRRLLDCLRQ